MLGAGCLNGTITRGGESTMDEELRISISRLRRALETTEKPDADNEVPDDVGLSVDDLRRSLWGALTTTFATDAEEYLVAMRVRRASEMLQDLLADLYTGTLSMRAPGTDELRAVTSELNASLEGLSG